jgi:hypothetical protein
MSENGHRRHEERSLALHREAVRLLRADPALAQRALEILEHWAGISDARSAPVRERWREIIDRRHWELAVDESELGKQLRQSSPLSFVIPEQRRREIMRQFAKRAQ